MTKYVKSQKPGFSQFKSQFSLYRATYKAETRHIYYLLLKWAVYKVSNAQMLGIYMKLLYIWLNIKIPNKVDILLAW